MPDETTSASTAEASGAATSEAEGATPPETTATVSPSAKTETTTATTASNGSTEKSAESMSERELRASLRGENPMEREITADVKRGKDEEDFDPTNPFPESDDPLESLLEIPKAESGEQKEETETETADGAQETEGTTATTEETAKTKAGDEPDEDEVVNEDGKTKSKRIRVNLSRLPDRDAAILRLASEKGLSLKDAETRLFGEQKAGSAGQGATETAAATEPTLDEIEGQIDELETAKDAALLTLDEVKVKELRGKLKVAQKARDAAQARAVEARTKAAAAESERTNSVRQNMARATEIYPDAVNESSVLFKDIQAEVTRLEQSDPAFFRNPKWPILVAAGCAAERGIAPTVKAAAAATTTKAVVKQVPKPARQAPAPASGSASARAVTQQAVEVDPSTMGEKEMRLKLRELDPPGSVAA